jgi:NADPH:quinone reductase-like Zn-dependent oxidoreductase
MRNAAAGAAGLAALQPLNPTVARVEIDSVEVTCAEVETQEPEFDAASPGNAHRVLLRVRGFSCGAGDRARIVSAASRFPTGRFYVLGSGFVADVLEVGREVTTVVPGERVVGDNTWPGLAGAAWRGGIPTRHASREYLVLREEKVTTIPPDMDLAEAAGFSIAAQTAYALVERVGAGPGSRVLLTSGGSATSLVALDLLRRLGAEVHVTTTSPGSEAWLRQRGARAVFPLGPAPDALAANEDLMDQAAEIGGFDCVVDPFFDLHLAGAVGLMSVGGHYVTSGQQGAETGEAAAGYGTALGIAVLKNLQIRGSALGSREHLQRALADHARGVLRMPVDSVWGGGRVAEFLQRSFCDPARRGKAVYLYD